MHTYAKSALWRQRRLGVVGAGNMARAIVGSIVNARLVDPKQIVVADPVPAQLAGFREMGAETTGDNTAAAACDVLLMAVKPQIFRQVAENMMRAADPSRRPMLVVSIAAGITLKTIKSLFPCPVVRVMPNTPLLTRQGMTALAADGECSQELVEMAESLFSAAGEVVTVDESLMDAVTAVSGSGPAYMFRFAEVFSAAAEAAGLSPELARQLAIQTMRGAVEMLKDGVEPEKLRQMVTSPGGTTAAGLAVMEERDFPGIIREVVLAAKRRSGELSQS